MKAEKIHKHYKKVSILFCCYVLVMAGCSSSNSNAASDLTSDQVVNTTINETTTTLPMTCEERGLKSIESILLNLESDRERQMRSESVWDDPDVDYILEDVFPIESEVLQDGEVACRVQSDVYIQDGDFRDTVRVSMVLCMDPDNSFMLGFSGTEMLTALDECLASLRGAPEQPDFAELSEELREKIAALYRRIPSDPSACEEAADLSASSSYRRNELFYAKLEECLAVGSSTHCIAIDEIARAVKSETSAIAPAYKYFRDLRDELCQAACDKLVILEDSPDERTRGINQEAKDGLFKQTQIKC